MKLYQLAISLLWTLYPAMASAQNLSPEDIAGLVDERLDEVNPYQSLLNDPDPRRSLLALEVMLESGDAELVDLALEFGLLSPDPNVRMAAFESWLGSSPTLSFSFEFGSNPIPNIFRIAWNGSVIDGVGYWRITVGEYQEDKRCFTTPRMQGQCFITITPDGIFFSPTGLDGLAQLTQEGTVVGRGEVKDVDQTIPFSLRLID